MKNELDSMLEQEQLRQDICRVVEPITDTSASSSQEPPTGSLYWWLHEVIRFIALSAIEWKVEITQIVMDY